MASIIPGYEYDIFISYRQKDNKHEGWVTDFVENLKGELESTFKEDISVYFDINPHDGLLETHDVDASLKEKIKCLVFIPIISKTYCDPKSFAWEHEFKAFIDFVSHDRFGLKVKLADGNVTNRVLPVRIHDLDADDIKLCESILGGFLRGVEFIYKEPGVNRPLTPGDDEKKNLNKTRYRNQINKVANAIKEIITGLKTGKEVSGKEKPDTGLPWEEVKKEKRIIPEEQPSGLKKSKLLSYIISAVFVLILLGVYVYPKIFKHNTLEKSRSSGEKLSVAVMPFKNMTNDTNWNVWQEGIQMRLISSFSNSGELQVRNKESIQTLFKNQGKGLTELSSFSPDVAGTISEKLDADIFIYGSIQKSGREIGIDAQLIDTRTKEVLKSFEVNGPYSDSTIFPLTDSIRNKVRDFLLIKKLIKENPLVLEHATIRTNSPEALRYFVYGENEMNKGDFSSAITWYLKALAVDSTFWDAATNLEMAYSNSGNWEQSRRWVIRNYEKRNQMDYRANLWVTWAYDCDFNQDVQDEMVNIAKQQVDLDEENPYSHCLLGISYLTYDGTPFIPQQYDKAILEYEKYNEIMIKWWGKKLGKEYSDYYDLGSSYQKAGQYKKAKKIYKEQEYYFPHDTLVFRYEAILSLAQKDTTEANRYIAKWIPHLRDSSSNANIASALAGFYSDEHMLDESEKFFRKALSLEPENPGRLRDLANFLTDNSRNLDEVPGLTDRAMKLAKNKFDFYEYMNTKGWGLYKQGKYKEALEITQKAWDEAPFKVYEIRSHLEQVKKAVASQKTN